MHDTSEIKSPVIYAFSGLGADARVFQRLKIPPWDIQTVRWLPPLKNESLEHYALRLMDQIPDENPVLLGLSFGGMIALEIAKKLGISKVILIGSVTTYGEIPFYYRWAGILKLHRIVPTRILKFPNFFTQWLFGTQNRDERKILKQILRDTDPAFLKWAVNAVLTWKNETVPDGVIHIHGTEDRVIPIKYVNATHPIQGGGHLMTLNLWQEVSAEIRKILESDRA